MNENTSPNYETQQLSSERVRIRFRKGDTELETEGSRDFVDGIARQFFTTMRDLSNGAVSNSVVIPAQVEHTQTTDFTPHPSPTSPIGSLDLLTFFRQKSPRNQTEEVAIVTYYLTKYQENEHLSLEQYEEAYQQLRKLGINVPSNMKSSVRNVVDRTKYLYNPVRGRFALTVVGEELVESMDSRESV